MKIAYVSCFDPTDISSWSGCSYYLSRALAKDPSITLNFVGPLKYKSYSVLQRCKVAIYSRVLGRIYTTILIQER